MRYLYLMRFGEQNKILPLFGDVIQDTKIRHMFEKAHPFITGKRYSYGRYYEDELEVTVVADSETTETIRDMLDVGLTGDVVFAQWNYGTRQIETEELPQIHRLRGAVRISCKSTYKQKPLPINATAWLDGSVVSILEKEIRRTE